MNTPRNWLEKRKLNQNYVWNLSQNVGAFNFAANHARKRYLLDFALGETASRSERKQTFDFRMHEKR